MTFYLPHPSPALPRRQVWFLILLIASVTADLSYPAQGITTTRRDPAGPVRMIAEWEPAHGTLIRWPLGIPMSLVRELAADDTLYTLVEGAGAENSARSSFESGGVNLDHVRFIQAQVYSMWTRDWGPQCIFDGNGQMGITDPWFDGYPWVPGCNNKLAPADDSPRTGTRGYEEDDVINGTVATALGLSLHQLPAYCTGGNIMTDGHGRAFSTQQMLDENAPHMSNSQFFDRTESYLGITDYQILANPEIHGIQHIDCYAKLLDEETVLVKEVPSWHPEYACVETLASAFAALTTCYGRPYNVIRIWCAPYSGDRVAAYTNSLILNHKVLVPTFGLAADTDALATYSQAMPGYEVIGFDYGSWYYYDALHCRTMGIFDRGMLRIWHRRLNAIVSSTTCHRILAEIDDRSETGLVPGAQKVRWRLAGQTGWIEIPLSPTVGDSFQADIPGQPPATQVEYYLTASDQSGRTETAPRTAPDGFYSFQVDPDLTDMPVHATTPCLRAHPNPGNPQIAITFTLSAPGTVHLAVFDLRGRLVATLKDSPEPAGQYTITWAGKTDGGMAVPSGTYLARLTSAGIVTTCRLTLLR
jgi:agmatine/peptidylarginine deiminase